MKKLLLVFPIVALLAAGCNSSQQAAITSPIQTPITQNTNPAPTPSPTPTSSNSTTQVDQTSNWKTYTNTKYFIVLKYPANFSFSESNNSGGIFDVMFNDPNSSITQTHRYYLDNEGFQLSIAPVTKYSNLPCQGSCTEKTINGNVLKISDDTVAQPNPQQVAVRRDIEIVHGSYEYLFATVIAQNVSTGPANTFSQTMLSLKNQTFNIDKVAQTLTFSQ